MIVYKRKSYDLLISHDPNELFDYYEVEEMHGLNAKDCKAHINDETQAYIAGLSNFVPKKEGEYPKSDHWQAMSRKSKGHPPRTAIRK